MCVWVVHQCIERLQPDVVAAVDAECDAGGREFVPRFVSCLDFHWGIFEAHETVVQSEHRKFLHTFEHQYFGLNIPRIVSCEGRERRVHPQTWRQRSRMLEGVGLRLTPVSPDIDETEQQMLKCYSSKFGLLRDTPNTLCLMYLDRPLLSASSWIPMHA